MTSFVTSPSTIVSRYWHCCVGYGRIAPSIDCLNLSTLGGQSLFGASRAYVVHQGQISFDKGMRGHPICTGESWTTMWDWDGHHTV